MSWIKNTVFYLLLFLLSVQLTFVVLEVSLKIFDIGYGSASLESNPSLHHSHPTSYQYRSLVNQLIQRLL